jgi:hypothetical protein
LNPGGAVPPGRANTDQVPALTDGKFSTVRPKASIFKERIIELKTIYASRFGIRYQSDSFNIRGLDCAVSSRKLLYTEEFQSKTEAMKREKELKS